MKYYKIKSSLKEIKFSSEEIKFILENKFNAKKLDSKSIQTNIDSEEILQVQYQITD